MIDWWWIIIGYIGGMVTALATTGLSSYISNSDRQMEMMIVEESEMRWREKYEDAMKYVNPDYLKKIAAEEKDEKKDN